MGKWFAYFLGLAPHAFTAANILQHTLRSSFVILTSSHKQNHDAVDAKESIKKHECGFVTEGAKRCDPRRIGVEEPPPTPHQNERDRGSDTEVKRR